MPPYDASQKLLFSHPEMVAGLLELGVDEDWVAEADLAGMQLVPSSYVSRDLRKRRGDMVWCIQHPGGLIYLMLEFQSDVDHWMGVRFSTYSGLFWEQLIRVQKISRKRPLPPVFPLLLFNGKGRWRAPQSTDDLFDPASEELLKCLNHGKYYLVDMHRFRSQDLAGCKNPFACLVRLENSRTMEEVERVVEDLIAWFPGEKHQSLRQDMASWLLYVFLPGRFPGLPVPESVEDLMGFKSMLRERVKQWPQEWMKEGKREAEREILMSLLVQKFGDLPEECRRDVSMASTPALRKWTNRILDSDKLEQVFQ